MPKVTQQVMGNEVAKCSGPFTLTAPGRREGRRREEGGKEEGSQQGGLWAWAGGGGAEVPLQPSECEPGLAGAGVQRQRREEQARARQERRGRDGGGERPWQRAKGESERARQCWGHWEWGLGGSQRPHIQSNQRGHREKVGGLREGRSEDKAWELGSSPSHTPCTDGKTEAGEAKGSVQGHIAKPGASLWVP